MKQISYRQQKLIKPDNISMRMVKKLVDNYGSSIPLQEVVNLVSKEKTNLLKQLKISG